MSDIGTELEVVMVTKLRDGQNISSRDKVNREPLELSSSGSLFIHDAHGIRIRLQVLSN